jgi:hypothetical protein
VTSTLRRPLVILAFAAVAALLVPASASASHPLCTGVVDGGPFNRPAEMPAAFDYVRAAGATTIRLYASWRRTAPGARPSDPADPADSAYDWSLLDLQVQLAKARGLEPILSIEGAGVRRGTG